MRLGISLGTILCHDTLPPRFRLKVDALPHANVLDALFEPHAHLLVSHKAMLAPYFLYRLLRMNKYQSSEHRIVRYMA